MMLNTPALLISAMAFAFSLPATTLGEPKNQSISFTENKGQVHDQYNKSRPDVLFSGTDGDLVFHLKGKGISYQLTNITSWKEVEDPKTSEKIKEVDQRTTYRLDIDWLNTNPAATVFKGEAYPDHSNFYTTVCPDGILNVKQYADVTYTAIYKGINLKWYQNNQHLKYDYQVEAGADYQQIRFKVNGAEKISINSNGELILKTPFGEIIEQKPLVIQNNKPLPARWVVNKDVVSFSIDNINPSLAFVIDPAIRLWGTYYGGTGSNEIEPFCALDPSGNVFMAGRTDSNDGTSIATVGSYQSTYGTNHDAYLVKFNPSGQRLWATYYGGDNGDMAFGCAADALGNVYIAGSTFSGIGISTPGSHQVAHGGGIVDAFLAKFDNSGARQWATYYGGSDQDQAYSCATDLNHNVYIVGSTISYDAISTPGAYQENLTPMGIDSYMAKFNSAGQRQWGTYYGAAESNETSYSCCTDRNGNAYMTGATYDVIYGALGSPGSHQPLNGSVPPNDKLDAFLVKFDVAGQRTWGTYYGGSSAEIGMCCITDSLNNVYLTGWTKTYTGTAIATLESYQPVGGGGVCDAFLVKFNSAGMRQWGTYYGDVTYDTGRACAIDRYGNVYMVGFTDSYTSSMFSTPGSHQTTYGGGTYDEFLVKFNTFGERKWATYYGGIGYERGPSCVVDAAGNIYMAGYTESTNGNSIATPGCHQPNYAGGTTDNFLVKFTGCSEEEPVHTTAPDQLLICNGMNTTLTATGPGALNWFSSPSSTVVIATGTVYTTPVLATGSYTFYVESEDCMGNQRVPVTVTVSACTAIEQLSAGEISFRIYPNPAKENVTIDLPVNAGIKITNVLGKVMMNEELAAGVKTLDLSNFYPGVYFVALNKNDSQITYKLIVE